MKLISQLLLGISSQVNFEKIFGLHNFVGNYELLFLFHQLHLSSIWLRVVLWVFRSILKYSISDEQLLWDSWIFQLKEWDPYFILILLRKASRHLHKFFHRIRKGLRSSQVFWRDDINWLHKEDKKVQQCLFKCWANLRWENRWFRVNFWQDIE